MWGLPWGIWKSRSFSGIPATACLSLGSNVYRVILHNSNFLLADSQKVFMSCVMVSVPGLSGVPSM